MKQDIQSLFTTWNYITAPTVILYQTRRLIYSSQGNRDNYVSSLYGFLTDSDVNKQRDRRVSCKKEWKDSKGDTLWFPATKQRPLAHSRKRSVKPRYDKRAASFHARNRSPFHLARSRLYGCCCSRSLWWCAGWWWPYDSSRWNWRCLVAPLDKLVVVAGRKAAATSAPFPAVASAESEPATTARNSLLALSYLPFRGKLLDATDFQDLSIQLVQQEQINLTINEFLHDFI